MTLLRSLLLSLCCLAWPAMAPAVAQGLTNLGAGDEPMEIDADEGIEWQRDRQVYIARGNAVVRRGDITVAADVLTAFYRTDERGDNEIYRIELDGNVVITSPNETVTGQHGVYTVDRGVFQLVGDNLRLETPEDVVTARDSLEYWEDYEGSPVAVARGDAVAERQAEGQRIRADTLTATLRPDEKDKLEISQVDAFGDVRIATASEYARGDRGVYYVKQQLAVLDGNVRITRGDNQLNGERAEINLQTGVSRLLSGSKDRVRGLLNPDSAKQSETE